MSDKSRKSEVALEAEIEQIRSLPVDQLRIIWRQIFKSLPSPAFAKDMLGRMICYHVQEKALGGLSRASQRLLDNMGEGKAASKPHDGVLSPAPFWFENIKASGIRWSWHRTDSTERHIRLLASLAFVAPSIVQSIIEGTAPANLTVTELAKSSVHSWRRQHHLLKVVQNVDVMPPAQHAR